MNYYRAILWDYSSTVDKIDRLAYLIWVSLQNLPLAEAFPLSLLPELEECCSFLRAKNWVIVLDTVKRNWEEIEVDVYLCLENTGFNSFWDTVNYLLFTKHGILCLQTRRTERKSHSMTWIQHIVAHLFHIHFPKWNQIPVWVIIYQSSATKMTLNYTWCMRCLSDWFFIWSDYQISGRTFWRWSWWCRSRVCEMSSV